MVSWLKSYAYLQELLSCSSESFSAMSKVYAHRVIWRSEKKIVHLVDLEQNDNQIKHSLCGVRQIWRTVPPDVSVIDNLCSNCEKVRMSAFRF